MMDPTASNLSKMAFFSEQTHADRSTITDINALVERIHNANVKVGWWTNPITGADLRPSPSDPQRITRNVPEMLALIHSEISEGLEGYRKGLMDDHLPHREMIEVEMADAVIRIMDLCGGLGLDLGGAIIEKLAYNAQRADHKLENRLKPGGKSI